MRRYDTKPELLQAIADAIRTQSGKTGKIAAQDFPSEILNIRNTLKFQTTNVTLNQVGFQAITFSFVPQYIEVSIFTKTFGVVHYVIDVKNNTCKQSYSIDSSTIVNYQDCSDFSENKVLYYKDGQLHIRGYYTGYVAQARITAYGI